MKIFILNHVLTIVDVPVMGPSCSSRVCLGLNGCTRGAVTPLYADELVWDAIGSVLGGKVS